MWLAWGAVIGSAAQFLVQLPSVIAILRDLRPSLAVRDAGVRTTLRAFVPVLLGRGSVQLVGYIDQALASYLGSCMVAALTNAQILYLLPVSLFGMAVSAAELPEMSSATGDEADRAAHLQQRFASALRRVVFLVVPSAVAFIAIGQPIVALLFQSGQFTAEDVHIVWVLLAGSAIGLSAGTQGRLLASAFYALGDPTRPLYAALVRVAITGTAGCCRVAASRRVRLLRDVGCLRLDRERGVRGVDRVLAVAPLARPAMGRVAIPGKLGLGALGAAIIAGAAGLGAAQLSTHIAIGSLAAIAALGWSTSASCSSRTSRSSRLRAPGTHREMI